MSTIVDERVVDEIEALKAILFDNELEIIENDRGQPDSVQTLVFPSTGEDFQSQYVCVRLNVKLTPGYPDTTPIVTLSYPRGLDEETVKKIQSDVDVKCNNFVGQPVMFELIELVREHLTKSNLPTGQCAVCLYGFREGDEFTKTNCYHHFHSYCLSAHIKAAENHYEEEQEKLPIWQQDATNKFQALCPVCREPINYDLTNFACTKPPIDVETAAEFSVTKDLLDMQQQMADLYLYQKQKGGIIDLEAEGIKLLVMTEDDSVGTQRPCSPGSSLHNINHSKEMKSKNQQSRRHSQNYQTPQQQSHNIENEHIHHRNRGSRSKTYHRRHAERLHKNDSSPR